MNILRPTEYTNVFKEPIKTLVTQLQSWGLYDGRQTKCLHESKAGLGAQLRKLGRSTCAEILRWQKNDGCRELRHEEGGGGGGGEENRDKIEQRGGNGEPLSSAPRRNSFNFQLNRLVAKFQSS